MKTTNKTAKVETAKTAKVETAKVETAKVETAKVETAKVETAKTIDKALEKIVLKDCRAIVMNESEIAARKAKRPILVKTLLADMKYDETASKAVCTAIFNSVKTYLQSSFRVSFPSMVFSNEGNTTMADIEAFTSYRAVMKHVETETKTGRLQTTGAGDVTGAKTAKTKETAKPETVISREKPEVQTAQNIDLTVLSAVADTEKYSEQTVDFKGTVYEMVSAYEDEIFACIMAHKNLLENFLTAVKLGQK